MMLSRYLDPKNDLSFKKIFGEEKYKRIPIDFLNEDPWSGIPESYSISKKALWMSLSKTKEEQNISLNCKGGKYHNLNKKVIF